MRQSIQEAHRQQRAYHPPLRPDQPSHSTGRTALPASCNPPFSPRTRTTTQSADCKQCGAPLSILISEATPIKDTTGDKQKWRGTRSGRRAMGEAPYYPHLVVPQLRQKRYITLAGTQCEAQQRRPRSARSLRDHSSLLALCEHIHTQDDTLVFWHGALKIAYSSKQ